MDNILNSIDPLVKWSAMLLTGAVYVFRTYATKDAMKELRAYVDKRHDDAISHTNSTTAQLVSVLTEIKDMVRTIDARTWEMQRDKDT